MWTSIIVLQNVYIKDWMTDNKLKLNDDKTEVMIISSSRMSTALSIPDSFDIGNASVPFSDTGKNLGFTLDCHLCLKTTNNSPPYLSELLTVYTAARQLRSGSDNSVLRRPSVRTVSYGQRSFAYSTRSSSAGPLF